MEHDEIGSSAKGVDVMLRCPLVSAAAIDDDGLLLWAMRTLRHSARFGRIDLTPET